MVEQITTVQTVEDTALQQVDITVGIVQAFCSRPVLHVVVEERKEEGAPWLSDETSQTTSHFPSRGLGGGRVRKEGVKCNLGRRGAAWGGGVLNLAPLPLPLFFSSPSNFIFNWQ